jgi:hypothetical protein
MILELHLSYLVLSLTSLHHIHPLNLPRSSYQFIPLYSTVKEKNKVLNYSKCVSK